LKVAVQTSFDALVRARASAQTLSAMTKQQRTLQVLEQGKRLRDISDLAFDLAV
jgi:hypothetical protein